MVNGVIIPPSSMDITATVLTMLVMQASATIHLGPGPLLRVN